MRLSTYRWLVPGPACVLLQVSFGSFYAYGVFSSRLSTPALTYGLGLAAALLSASLTAAGLALHRRPPPASPARGLALGSAALLAAAAALPVFAGTAPAAPRPLFLAAAAAALGAGYGALYVVSIHTAQAWFPEAPGTATGAVVAAGGAGTLLYIALNTALANVRPFDVPAAMRASAAVATATALAAAAAISLPPDPNWHPDDDSEAEAEAEATVAAPLMKRRVSSRGASSPLQPRLTAGDLLVDPLFYLLLVTVTSSVGPGFGVVLHGSRMQTALFTVSPAVADARFFGITLVGVAGRLAVGVAVDAYTAAVARRNFGAATVASAADAVGAPFVAARAANLGLLGAQAVALVAAVGLARTGGNGAALLFSAALSVVYLTFSGSAVVTACLCRATFAPENATLAFSLVGLAIGFGDVFFSAVVARCAEHSLPASGDAAAQRLAAQHAADYDAFFAISFLFTAVGVCSCIALVPADFRRSGAASTDSLVFDGAPPSLYDDLMCTKGSAVESQDVLDSEESDDDLRELREFASA